MSSEDKQLKPTTSKFDCSQDIFQLYLQVGTVYPQSFLVNCYPPTTAAHPENWDKYGLQHPQVESKPA